jgi:hypothetical protein
MTQQRNVRKQIHATLGVTHFVVQEQNNVYTKNRGTSCVDLTRMGTANR